MTNKTEKNDPIIENIVKKLTEINEEPDIDFDMISSKLNVKKQNIRFIKIGRFSVAASIFFVLAIPTAAIATIAGTYVIVKWTKETKPQLIESKKDVKVEKSELFVIQDSTPSFSIDEKFEEESFDTIQKIFKTQVEKESQAKHIDQKSDSLKKTIIKHGNNANILDLLDDEELFMPKK